MPPINLWDWKMELSIWEIGNGQVPLPSRIVPTQVQCRGQPGVERLRLSMFPPSAWPRISSLPRWCADWAPPAAMGWYSEGQGQLRIGAFRFAQLRPAGWVLGGCTYTAGLRPHRRSPCDAVLCALPLQPRACRRHNDERVVEYFTRLKGFPSLDA